MRWLWLPMLAATGFLVFDALGDGRVAAAVINGALGLAISWWFSPWQGQGRGASQADVERMSVTRPVVIYWRPGCIYCTRLRARLHRVGRRAIWVNIWQDPEATAFVRGVNEGDETVPTVVIDGRPITNPDPQLVLDRLRS